MCREITALLHLCYIPYYIFVTYSMAFCPDTTLYSGIIHCIVVSAQVDGGAA